MKYREQDVVKAGGKIGVVVQVSQKPDEPDATYRVEFSAEEGGGWFEPEQMELYQHNLLRRLALWMMGISCAALLGMQLARWSLMERITIPLEASLEVGVVLVFLVSIVVSTAFVPRRRIYWPFLLHVGIGMVVLMFPFSSVVMSWNYNWHLEERQAVVQLVETGKLGQNDGLVKLPEPYRDLSSGGEVLVQRESGATKVLFYTFHGLDSFGGFLYKSDGRYPFGMGTEIEEKDDRWYWVAE